MSTKHNLAWVEQQLATQKKSIYPEEERLKRLSLLKQVVSSFQQNAQNLKVLHITGSKGKGSTSLYLDGTLRRLGYRTLLFTSPHVFSIRERILCNGKMLDEEIWENALENIFTRFSYDFSYFDTLVLVAFFLSYQEKIDYLILEAGMGGRLDGTNICSPIATLITQIEKEHTQILGPTVVHIAKEKAGILKPSVPLFLAEQTPEVFATIAEHARNLNVPIFYVPDSGTVHKIQYCETEHTFLQNVYFILRDAEFPQVCMRMLGAKQCANALLALLCITELFPHQSKQVEQAWRQTLQEDSLPARFSIVQKDPLIVLDGCHTVQSFADTIQTWNHIITEHSHDCLIFTCKPDKDLRGMLPYFAFFSHIIITGDMDAFFPIIQADYPNACYLSKEKDACTMAKNLSPNGPILAAGSFYSLAKIKQSLLN